MSEVLKPILLYKLCPDNAQLGRAPNKDQHSDESTIKKIEHAGYYGFTLDGAVIVCVWLPPSFQLRNTFFVPVPGWGDGAPSV